MWTDYYLKFEDLAAFRRGLPDCWLVDGTPLPASEVHAMDVIGTLYHNETGAVLEGFHVNVRLCKGASLPESMALAMIEPPQYPKQVFA